MKKYVIYIGILLAGLLLGWLFFGNSSNNEAEHDHTEMTSENQMWTCSMHPQIMQPEAGDCPICGMDLIPAEAGADGLRPEEFKLTKNAMALANIQTSIVDSNQGNQGTVKFSGKISENEDANVVQASYFSGRIERLNISSVGEKVRKGQLLATIYSPELFSAQQELITASKLKESQPALYRAVRNKLKLWKISDKQINEIEASGRVKQNFPIYATVSGTVSEKLVEQGDYVKQGEVLLRISNLNTVWALFDAYESQIDLVKEGDSITIITNAFPNRKIEKEIDFIDPIMNTQTRTLKIRVVLNNAKGEFKTGMFVEGTIEKESSNSEEKLSIPATSILWTGKRSVVYVKTNPKEPVFAMREVTLGKKLGEFYEIIDGLKNGDEVVTNGTFTIDAAAQLQGKKSMMNKNGGETMTGHEGHGMHSLDNNKEILDFDSEIEESFQAVIVVYIELKDALVKSDTQLSADKSKLFRQKLEEISMKKREKTHGYWSILHKTSKGIDENANLDKQRDHFKMLSDKLIEMVMNFKSVNNQLYVQYCPMADNDKGAYWLSHQEQIKNPYFGDMMLKCGEVKQIIK